MGGVVQVGVTTITTMEVALWSDQDHDPGEEEKEGILIMACYLILGRELVLRINTRIG